VDAGTCTYTHTTVSWDPTVSDNCTPTASITLTHVLTGATVGSGGYSVALVSFNAGATTVTWTAKDASGNSSTCSYIVNVTDNINPTISCPTDIVVGNDAGICGAVVNLYSPVYSDNCPGSVLTQLLGLPVVQHSRLEQRQTGSK